MPIPICEQLIIGMINLYILLIVEKLLAQPSTRDVVQLAVLGELILYETHLQSEWIELIQHASVVRVKPTICIIPAQLECMWCFFVYCSNKKTAYPQWHSVG